MVQPESRLALIITFSDLIGSEEKLSPFLSLSPSLSLSLYTYIHIPTIRIDSLKIVRVREIINNRRNTIVLTGSIGLEAIVSFCINKSPQANRVRTTMRAAYYYSVERAGCPVSAQENASRRSEKVTQCGRTRKREQECSYRLFDDR